MAIIDSYRGIITVFIEYSFSEQSEDAIEKLKVFFEQNIKGKDGLISVNYHLAEDGQSIYNYSQWKNEESFDLFLNDKTTVKATKELKGFKTKITKTKVVFTS